jgi:peroxiredoxin
MGFIRKIGTPPIAALLAFAFLTSSFAPGTARSAGNPPLRIGDVPPRATLRDLKGETVMLPGQYRGKVLVIHFWAVGCSSCREEMAALESLSRAYSGKGLAVLAVNVGQKKETVEKMTRSLGRVLLDSDGEMARRYDVAGIPRTFLIDRSGVIRYKIVGESNEPFLRKRIQSIL